MITAVQTGHGRLDLPWQIAYGPMTMRIPNGGPVHTFVTDSLWWTAPGHLDERHLATTPVYFCKTNNVIT